MTVLRGLRSGGLATPISGPEGRARPAFQLSAPLPCADATLVRSGIGSFRAAPSVILGVALGPVRVQFVFEASLITMMVLFGSAMYLATVVMRAPSTVERIRW